MTPNVQIGPDHEFPQRGKTPGLFFGVPGFTKAAVNVQRVKLMLRLIARCGAMFHCGPNEDSVWTGRRNGWRGPSGLGPSIGGLNGDVRHIYADTPVNGKDYAASLPSSRPRTTVSLVGNSWRHFGLVHTRRRITRSAYPSDRFTRVSWPHFGQRIVMPKTSYHLWS